MFLHRDAEKLSDITMSEQGDGDKLNSSVEDENDIDEAYESIRNNPPAPFASALPAVPAVPAEDLSNKPLTTVKTMVSGSSVMGSGGGGSGGEELRFPIPKNILINRKAHSKSSSYYRQNDERLESDTETDSPLQPVNLNPNTNQNNSHSSQLSSTVLSAKNKDDDPTRIRPKSDVKDPVFQLRPSDRLMRLGETVKFVCKVSGTRPLEVFWYKLNGDELQNNEKYEMYHDDEFHYLKIFNTTQQDSGMYLCVISNEIEQNIDSFLLTLRGKQTQVSRALNPRSNSHPCDRLNREHAAFPKPTVCHVHGGH